MHGATSGTGSTDSDYFAFDITTPGRLGLEFKFPNNLGTSTAYNLTIYDANGDQRFGFDTTGGDWSGTWASQYAMFLPAGRYYLRVDGRNTRVSWGQPYTIRVAPMLTSRTPTVAGTPTFGKTLTARSGSWAPSGVKLTTSGCATEKRFPARPRRATGSPRPTSDTRSRCGWPAR